METLNLEIEGMSCGHCVARVERALRSVPGLRVEHVAVGEARVSLDGDSAAVAAVVATLGANGYAARVAEARP